MSERSRPPVYSPLQDDQRLPDPPGATGGSGGGSVTCPPEGFPWINVTAIATTSSSGNTTSHTVNLPSIVGTSGGKLCCILFGVDGNATVSATGWTATAQANSSGNCSAQVLYKWLTGSEGATVSVTTSASETLQAVAFVVEDAHGSTAPEVATVTAGTVETLLNPPNLTPSWGAANTLWVPFVVQDSSGGTGSQALSQPVRYLWLQELLAANTGHVYLGSAYRWLNAASEDPGTFRVSNGEQYAGLNVAIRPV